MRTAIWAPVLFGFYLGLSGQWSNTFLVGSGAAASLLVAVLMPRLEPKLIDGPFSHLRALFVYLPWLALQVLIANLKVMRAVWTPGRVSPQVVRVPCTLRSGFGRAVFANSITLTPGTVSMLLDGDEIVVHALTAEDAAGVASGDMHARVHALESDSPPAAPGGEA